MGREYSAQFHTAASKLEHRMNTVDGVFYYVTIHEKERAPPSWTRHRLVDQEGFGVTR
jgi:hypothetical protein